MSNKLNLAAIVNVLKRLNETKLLQPKFTVKVWNDSHSTAEKQLERAGNKVVEFVERVKAHNAAITELKDLIGKSNTDSENLSKLVEVRQNLSALQQLVENCKKNGKGLTVDQFQAELEKEKESPELVEVTISSYTERYLKEEIKELTAKANEMQAALTAANKRTYMEISPETMNYLLEYEYL